MTKKITILITAAIIAASAVLFWLKNDIIFLSQKIEEIEKTADVFVGEIKKEISNPAPLRAIRDSRQAFLTQAGTIGWTNIQRTNNGGLPPLAENVELDAAAARKAQDMFNRQYFEHVSPDSKNVGDLVEAIGYEYIAVGENLALGNYKDDQELVQAWMDSPGHRANILSTKFTEIGVAVGRGLFEGKQTWLAVQVFARPLSACPEVDATLKSQIDWLKLQVTELKIKADTLLDEMENYKKRGNREEYNRKVEEYNALAQQINSLVVQLKNMVIKYNDQVRAFNACIAGS